MKSPKPRSFLLALLLLITAGLPLAHANTTQAEFTEAELDQLLAPIALYPDTVLSHVLIASTYPLEVVQADRWARANPGISAEDAVAAVENRDWEPSVKALVAFPQILERMSDDLAWTQRLGDAFLDNEARVMDAIQNLRNKAYAAGSLDRLEHVRVQRERDVIVIEPAVERVVYVPVYDTRVVYGHWWWNDYPPVYWHSPAHYTYINGFYWGPRVYVGPSFFFSSFHWQRRHVVYVDYHRYHHRPHFYSGRSIASYSGARQWRHNPTHRRGVAYHNDRARQHYGSNRQSYSTVHEQRGTQSQWRRDQQNANRARRDAEAGGQGYRGNAVTTARPNNLHESERVRDRLANREARAARATDGTSGERRERTEGAQQWRREGAGRPAGAERGAERETRRAANEVQRPTQQSNSTQGSVADPRPARGAEREVRTLPSAPNPGSAPGVRSNAQPQVERRSAPIDRPERATRFNSDSGARPERNIRSQQNTRSGDSPRARRAE